MKPKIIVISKQTSFDRFIQEENNPIIELSNLVAANWKTSHKAHSKTLDLVVETVQDKAQLIFINTPTIDSIDIDNISLVITVGGDGTLLSASHNLPDNIPILGVNSDPKTSVGYFCYGNYNNFTTLLDSILENNYSSINLTRMQVKKNKKIISEFVLNDVLFCHACPANTSNYIIQIKDVENNIQIIKEVQKSSGFWIGPAAGSTAARKSAGATQLDLKDNRLQFFARELYTKPGAISGNKELLIQPNNILTVFSKMENAVMYIDGGYKAIPVGLGDEVVFCKSCNDLKLVKD